MKASEEERDLAGDGKRIIRKKRVMDFKNDKE